MTLVELLVTLTVLGVLAGVVMLAWHRAPRVDSVAPLASPVLAARDSALRTGHPVTVWIADTGEARSNGNPGVQATALPDGRVITTADTLLIDPLSGRLHDPQVP